MPLEPSAYEGALQTTIDLFDVGLELMRQNLRREHQGATEEEIEVLLRRWLHDRPGAEHGDCPGRRVNLHARLG